MIQKLKNQLLILASALMLIVPAAAPVAVSAATGCKSFTASGISTGASGALNGNKVDCSQANVGSNGLSNLAKEVVNIFSIVVGAVAVIMIIYGGFRYITSGGESGRVGNAKNTLIYAIIGLIIVALAQLIVHFVLAQTNNVNQ